MSEGQSYGRTSCFAVAACLLAALGGFPIGYDFGVTRRVLSSDSFLADFCVGYGKNTPSACKFSPEQTEVWLSFAALYNVAYYVGCVVGALSGGWLADRFGRRPTMGAAAVVYLLGALCLAIAPVRGHHVVLLSRLVQGVGSGKSSVAVPIYTTEIAPSNRRGAFSGLIQFAVMSGLLAGLGLPEVFVDFTGSGELTAWRLNVISTMVPPLGVAVAALLLPESPRWIYRHKSRFAAAVVLHRLVPTSPVTQTLDMIDDDITHEALASQDPKASSGWKALWHAPGSRRRMVAVMVALALQQMASLATVFSIAGAVFTGKWGIESEHALIFAIAAIGLVMTGPSLLCIDSVGRRAMLIMGSIGMCLGFLGAGLGLSLGCHGAIGTQTLECSSPSSIIFFTAVAFAVGMYCTSWAPMSWVYPAEIFPFRTRARAMSMAAMTCWSASTLMMHDVAGDDILVVAGVCYLLALLCVGSGVLGYACCVETKDVELEKVMELFPNDCEAPQKSADMSAPSMGDSGIPYCLNPRASSLSKAPNFP